MNIPRNSRGELDPAAAELLRTLMPTLEAIIDERVEERLQAQAQAEPLWSLKQVADYLNVSTRTVENLLAEGSIKPLRIRGLRRFHPDAIRAYVRTTTSPRR